MLKAALYIRVSTEEQTEYSPDAQKSALLRYAHMNNLEVLDEHIFMDRGISGRKAEKRPGFMKMISLAKQKPRPFDTILVHKFDRFARNREDSVVYKSLLRKECGIQVISITEHIEDDKFSIILESMLEAMAEYYSINLSEEVKKGMAEKAKRGEHSGTCPLGYCHQVGSKILQVDTTYSHLITQIFDMYVHKDMTLFEIAKALNMQGYTTKNNKLFSKRSLEYIIKNPVYSGYNRWNYRKGGLNVPNNADEWIIEKGKHTPLISRKLWDDAQEKYEANQLLHPRQLRPISEKRHWLSGLLRCYHCGGPMTANLIKGKYISFRCANYFKGSCNHPCYISGRKIEKYVLGQMTNDLNYTKEINLRKKHQDHDHNALERLQQQLKKAEKKYALANSSYLAEVDTLQEYQDSKAKIKKEEEAIVIEIERLKASLHEAEDYYSSSKIESICHLLDSTELTISEKHQIARAFIKQVAFDAHAKRVLIEYFVSDHVD